MPNTIYIGEVSAPSLIVSDATDALISVSGVLTNDPISEELTIDTVTFGIKNNAKMALRYRLRTKDQEPLRDVDHRQLYCRDLVPIVIPSIPYGTPISWYYAGQLVARFYAERRERTARYALQLTGISAVGILDKQDHMGGIYSGEALPSVLADILDPAFAYAGSSALTSQRVYGYLPIGSRRANLHRIIYAMGLSLTATAEGLPYFDFQSGTIAATIPEARIYESGSIREPEGITSVSVAEHTYYALPTDREVILFDNTDGSGTVSNQRIVFDDAPVHDITATSGLTIHSSNCNHAIISGVGILTGKAYTHTIRTVTAGTATGLDAVESIEDNTLINSANAQAVANRLLAYYTSGRPLHNAIVWSGERPGRAYTLTDPFMETQSGALASLELVGSGIIRADCDFVAGYTPQPGGNAYSQSVRLTGSGVFTVPAGKTMIRAVLISGGTGGAPGGTAPALELPPIDQITDRSYGSFTIYQKGILTANLVGGPGGDPGEGGAGGNVYVVDIPVTPGQQTPYNCGGRGAGGNPSTMSPGQDGGATTFGSYSSDSGAASPYGFLDIFSGTVYARPGAQGIAGAQGAGYSGGTTLSVDGQTWASGATGTPEGQRKQTGSISDRNGFLYGYVGAGYGGGPAYGANGTDGGNPALSQISLSSSVSVQATPGGRGANAQPFPAAAQYGDGGRGGNGGGGPGSIGTISGEQRISSGGGLDRITLDLTTGATLGGLGSYGSAGGLGCIIIQY